MTDAAHILFPNDAPPAAAGENAPVLRNPVATVIQGGKAVAPTPPAGTDQANPDTAAVLFKDDVTDAGAKAVTELLGGFANSAISDGDGGERARAIEVARDGLIADAKAHGTDTVELSEAMAVVKERQADSLVETTPEQAEQRMREGLEACQAEGISDADLGIARRFIVDLERAAPGTIATLERTGSGNDIRIIRKAIAEAKRRGYR